MCTNKLALRTYTKVDLAYFYVHIAVFKFAYFTYISSRVLIIFMRKYKYVLAAKPLSLINKKCKYI